MDLRTIYTEQEKIDASYFNAVISLSDRQLHVKNQAEHIRDMRELLERGGDAKNYVVVYVSPSLQKVLDYCNYNRETLDNNRYVIDMDGKNFYV